MDKFTSSQVTSDDVRCPLANIVGVLPRYRVEHRNSW